MKRVIAAALIGILAPWSVAFAVDGNKAQYIGGTIAGVQEKAEGTFATNDEAAIKFDAKKKGVVDIPYASITSLEYGQKAGRRASAWRSWCRRSPSSQRNATTS